VTDLDVDSFSVELTISVWFGRFPQFLEMKARRS